MGIQKRAYYLGLTGGIACGKSTVAGYFKALGASLVDADAISRSLTAPQGPAMTAISAQFGAPYVTTDGALDRSRMRQLVFEQPAARLQLEAILHPMIAQQCWELADAANTQQAELVVFDIPLLAQSAYWRAKLDAVLVLDCSLETQIQRVMQRDGLKSEQVLAIIQAQAPRGTRLAAADAVVLNESDDFSALQYAINEYYADLRLSFGHTREITRKP